MSATHVVLSVNHLSGKFRAQVLRLIGHPEIVFLTVQELRRKGLVALFKVLWSVHPDHLWLCLEHQEGQCLLPILQLLAVVMRARRVHIVNPNLETEVASLARNLFQGPLLGLATIRCLYSWYRVDADCRELLTQERLSFSREVEGVAKWNFQKLFYYKTNLWFGIKAGGSVAHVAGVTTALVRRGVGILMGATEPQATVKPEIEFLKLTAPEHYGLPPEANLYSFDQMATRQASQHLLEHFKPDVIYHRLAFSSVSAVALSRRFGCPLIVEYNGSEVWAQANWGTRPISEKTAQRCEDAVLAHAHVVVTVSDVLKEELVARGVSPARIVSYPNGVDLEVFNPQADRADRLSLLRQQLDLPDGSIVVGFVGTFGKWHGVEVFAKAIRYLADNRQPWLIDRKLFFVFVGDGLLMNEVQDQLKDCQAFARLPGLCPQSQAPDYLALFDVVVSPHVPNADGTRFFGSPTKLFEYMAMGKPILASDLEQIGEVLKNSHRFQFPQGWTAKVEEPVAVLLPPGDVRSLAEAICQVVDDAELRGQLATYSLREAKLKYSWDTHVHQIMTRLESLAESNSL
jgi:glycosyltransferase involved in cell wall biosynthesis